MGMIEPTTYNTGMTSDIISNSTDDKVMNQISGTKSGKEQLKKVSKEFESVFISKMFELMDKTVDKEGGIFGEETKYFDSLKSYMYTEMGRNLANNPNTTFGFAKQIYEQMERYTKD